MTDTLFDAAQRHIPGGVNSPVRAFNAVGGTPLFVARADGAYLYDTNGQRYLDYVGSWGPMVAGHAHPAVVRAVQDAASRGLSFGAPTVLETQMADTLCRLIPSLEKVRMVNSGTEAAMSAIRLARGFTGRDLLVKFEGCYHGHADSLLVKAGSGALTMGEPNSAGVPADLARHTVTLDYNNADQVAAMFKQCGHQIAAVIVEPVAGNMGCVPAQDEFLNTLKQCCDAHGALLIFDEVMTGFRVALGGAQAHYAMAPDLTILGKVIGGGLPVGAFGGRAAVMDHIAPTGPVYQAGTLSGNPVALSAGLATLELVSAPDFFSVLGKKTAQLVNGLSDAAHRAGVPFATHHVGGMFSVFFSTEGNIRSFRDVINCNTGHFKRFFHAMLERRVYFAPSPFEAGFMSAAHDDDMIATTIAAAREVFSDW